MGGGTPPCPGSSGARLLRPGPACRPPDLQLWTPHPHPHPSWVLPPGQAWLQWGLHPGERGPPGQPRCGSPGGVGGQETVAFLPVHLFTCLPLTWRAVGGGSWGEEFGERTVQCGARGAAGGGAVWALGCGCRPRQGTREQSVTATCLSVSRGLVKRPGQGGAGAQEAATQSHTVVTPRARRWTERTGGALQPGSQLGCLLLPRCGTPQVIPPWEPGSAG